MPILACELHVYRDDLLSQKVQTESRWVAIHTRSRQENVSMVGRHSLRISIDCPHLANRFRSAVGRLHTSHLPMHGNYVSVRCNRDDRYEVLQANLVPQTLEVGAGVELTRDPRRIQQPSSSASHQSSASGNASSKIAFQHRGQLLEASGRKLPRVGVHFPATRDDREIAR
jgi:hypothetical protein